MRTPNYGVVERSVLQYHVVAEKPTIKTLQQSFTKNKCKAIMVAALLQSEFLKRNWMIFDKKEDKTFYLWNSDVHSDIIQKELPSIYKAAISSIRAKAKMPNKKKDTSSLSIRIQKLSELQYHIQKLSADYSKEYETLKTELGPMIEILEAFKKL